MWVWKLSIFLFIDRILMSDVEFDDTLVDTHISQRLKRRSSFSIQVSTLYIYLLTWYFQSQNENSVRCMLSKTVILDL